MALGMGWNDGSETRRKRHAQKNARFPSDRSETLNLHTTNSTPKREPWPLYTFLLAHAARAYSAASAASSCAFSLLFFLGALDFGTPSASFLKRPAASSESVQYTSGTHGCVPL